MSKEQLLAILWLRWRLTRNQFARAGKVNAALSVMLLALGVMGALASAVGGVLFGLLGPIARQPAAALAAWDAILLFFLVFWLAGLMIEIQRSESVDLTKLLHLPIGLRQVFVFNYFASLFSFTLVLFLPGMLGVCAGVCLSRGPLMVLAFPLVLGFVFLLTTWTYWLRGWLAGLMINKRKRRAIIVWVTLALVFVGQLPNLVLNTGLFKHKHEPSPQASTPHPGQPQPGSPPASTPRGQVPSSIVKAHLLLPPGWVGYGTMKLLEGNPVPALGGFAASALLGALGLARAFRTTLKFYQGGEGAGQAPTKPKARVKGTLLVERRVPWLSEDTAALALANLRSLLRAPELKMALLLPIFMGAIGFSALTGAGKSGQGWGAFSQFMGCLVALVSVFSFASMMANMFGFDRGGFRALVLLPTPRDRMLLGKNLPFLALCLVTGTVLLLAFKFLKNLPWETFLAGILQVGIAFCVFSLGGNLLSIFAPYRVAAGTLQAKKPRAIVFVAGIASTLTMPVALIPVILGPALALLVHTLGWNTAIPINLLVSAAVLAGVAWVYRKALVIEGRLLQRRETEILKQVTDETE